MSEQFNQYLDNIVAAIPNIVTAILFFVASLYVAKLLSRLVKNILTKRNADHEVTHLLSQLTRWSIIVVGIILGRRKRARDGNT